MAHLDWSLDPPIPIRFSQRRRGANFFALADTPTLVIGGHFRAGRIRRTAMPQIHRLGHDHETGIWLMIMPKP